MLPSEDAVLLLLFDLLRTGQIKVRRLDGWQEIPNSVPIARKAACSEENNDRSTVAG